ncbi:MAG: hypothetical protein CL943_03815 [Candidatus Diapherotrites archaeon]|uniref:SEC-C domain-containing protein n=1 Tax=Candidatus Iainarchaeum sp. TaxID=3101447 RepID=A0A2D6M1W2_9ARCH|nr:hypothetical protein [Candidatus Diapherotrites archaeon]
MGAGCGSEDHDSKAEAGHSCPCGSGKKYEECCGREE